jgi:membrane complex biogenesis BtpA family protein
VAAVALAIVLQTTFTDVIDAVKFVIKTTAPVGISFWIGIAWRGWTPAAVWVSSLVSYGVWAACAFFPGAFAGDFGLWVRSAGDSARYRRQIGAENVRMLFNINAEFADTLDRRPIELRARSAVFSSLADGILVSGALTGQGVNTSDLQRVVEALEGKVPVFANTGVTLDTVSGILALADGCVVGTHFKVDGVTWNAVDGDRVKRFMDRVNTLR